VAAGDHRRIRNLHWVFRRALASGPQSDGSAVQVHVPVFVLVVLGLTLLGFAVTSPLGISPAWSALAGAVVLGVRALCRRDTTAARIVAAADIPFLAFVLCLGVVVDAVMFNGLDSVMRDVVPTGDDLWTLLGIAAVAAVLSNVVNNLPAVLVLLPLVAASGPAAGSRCSSGSTSDRTCPIPAPWPTCCGVARFAATGCPPASSSRVGLCTTPVTLFVSVLGLWAGLQVLGT
jgi:arsenical pump membrane protein